MAFRGLPWHHAGMRAKASKTRKSAEEDVNQIAARLVAAISENQPTAAERKTIGRAFGLLGASKGGKARAAKLSAAKRKAIAKKAAKARWKKTTPR